MDIIGAMMTLLGFQLAGEVIARALGLPLPGPVLGMLLLFAVLIGRGAVPPPLRTVGQALLNHLSLLFVPAGVGIMTHMALLRTAWLPIAATLVLSTLVTLAVTALVLTLLLRSPKGGRA
ncbi:MAG TPA: CidA/LrgA family protein [Kouleothrix sp.]|jgi:holin-like protein|nr:CidA/LrgA family protein [Kouleothrix sp.]